MLTTFLMFIPEIAEPFDQLGSVGFIEFNVRKIVTQDCRARVAAEEEHQLGFTQMQ